ncbi:hypothetical protein, partial [Chryseobacterium sp. CH1]|uniref:hypothetical protein n=1 Tax=Chryseobacterium sp. CH1 TaxID=713551 RepID=UPI0010259FA2
PYFGVGCRCVKIKYDASGNEEGPASRITVVPNDPTLSIANIELKVADNKITLYPSLFWGGLSMCENKV